MDSINIPDFVPGSNLPPAESIEPPMGASEQKTRNLDVVSFGHSIDIVSPETNLALTYLPKTTAKSPKWAYPYPFNDMNGNEIKLKDIQQFLGEKLTLEFFHEAFTRHCQATWKDALKEKNNDPYDAANYFIVELFNINRRTGEDTPEKIAKRMTTMLMDIKKAKANGTPIEELKTMMEEYKALKQQHDDLILS